MGFIINGDLIPVASGFANLGVDVNTSDIGAFDFASLTPFGHIHLNSGIFHHATSTGWESGVIRFNSADPSFEVSLDGGITFNNLVTAATVVTSVGVLGDVNLTGDVDFASPASGFIVIQDSANASPLLWSVDVWALSGLYGFPTNGFSNMARCFSATFSGTTWTVNHNLNTTAVVVQTQNGASPSQVVQPDSITITNANTVTIKFNVSVVAGRATIIAC